MIRPLLRKGWSAIVRDWRVYDDPQYYLVSGAVFVVGAVILIFGGSPTFGVLVLLFGVFCFWRANRAMRHRRRQ